MSSFGMDFVFWLMLPAAVACGASCLVWLLMQARIEVLKARCQTAVARLEHDLESQKTAAQEALRTAEGMARQAAFDEFLADLHVEQRRFVRRTDGANNVVVQERIYLRDIPISGWMEHELALGQGGELAGESLALEAAPRDIVKSVVPIRGK
ncbi:MAG TPA: hypothetical protein VG675_18230 [Bryobacteraceae bacterium]|nr:hypothetical protein [Bryobacteraceae bacterium]